MSLKPETASPVVPDIITGHFHALGTFMYSVWRPHGTPDWLLIGTLRGAGRFGYPGGELRAGPGSLVLLRPGTLHDYGRPEEAPTWEFLWTHFHPRDPWRDLLAWPEVAPGLMCLDLAQAQERARIMRRLADAYRVAIGPHPRAHELAFNALEEVLLRCDAENPRGKTPPLDGRVRRAMELMLRDMRKQISLDDLAEQSGLSASRLGQLFREQLGRTPQQFIELHRLRRAQQLLERTNRAISEIAYDVGYESPFYFTLRFKKHTGQSPRAYRAARAGPRAEAAKT